MSNHKHTGGIFGKGYYIALIACAAAIGVTGFLYYRNAGDAREALAGADSAVVAEADGQDQNVAATRDSGRQSTEGSEATTAPTVKKQLKTGAPVSGETVTEFAVETLSYNETTRDWRTHAGIDIAAEEGTPVLAAAEGVVYTVCEDDTMGTTVVIRHEDDYITQYSSLAAEVSVSAGDVVALGQQIGTVGSSALLESAIGDHVHFCVLYQDEPMDPAEFFALGEGE